VTLPESFKQLGYFAASSGKVFHPSYPPQFDFPKSWSELPVCQQKDVCIDSNNKTQMTCSFSPGDTTPDADAECANLTLATLASWHQNATTHEAQGRERQPFFLAAGFQSPRLDWSYPAAVAARYPPAQQIKIAKQINSPANSSLDLEWFRPTEVDWYTNITVTHDRPMPLAMQHVARRA
jgi:iduronate 2-sulfatase